MSLFNTTLCNHSQQPSDQPSFHLDPRLLVRVTTKLQKSSQQEQITVVQLVLNVKFVFMHHSVHSEKCNLLSWAIRPVFTDPVTYEFNALKRRTSFLSIVPYYIGEAQKYTLSMKPVQLQPGLRQICQHNKKNNSLECYANIMHNK